MFNVTLERQIPTGGNKFVEKQDDKPDFLRTFLPMVLETEGDVGNFDPVRIVQSLMKETGLQKENALNVTELVVRRIISSGIRFLSGPHIREMTCAALAELNFENERKLYTRIGMPLMDYEAIVEQGVKENANQYSNPESCHTWAADHLAQEYSLLRLMPHEGAEAHLSGDIHVHMLRYFDLRPFCQEWDLRLILKYGLPPVKWAHSAVSKPARTGLVAMLHAAKWLGIVQGEFSGGQGFDNFTSFLAPYVRGMSDKQIKQLAQCFIFESNQIYAARGAQVPFTSISCTPAVPEMLKNIDAIGPGGVIMGTYGDYDEECRRLFSAITQVYTDGDGQGKLFNFPKHEVKLRRDWLQKFEKEYLEVVNEAAVMGTPYFLNQCASWLPDEIHSQCCRIILTPDGMRKMCEDPEVFDWSKSWMNMGSLQSVSVNLPRISYQARGNDNRFFEILEDKLRIMRDILLVKLQILKRRIATRILPICAGVIDGQPMLDFRKQSLSIGFVGLNEMAKYHTGYELHESNDAFNFGMRVCNFISNKCEEYSDTNKIKFSMWEQPAESTANRFALLDMKHYPDQAIFQGNRNDGSAYYTNSSHLNYGADIDLQQRVLMQAKFHPIVKGGVITHLWMGEQQPDREALWQLTKNIACKTDTAYFAYTFDFSWCTRCGTFARGVVEKCTCGATGDEIEWYSRITGYYSRVRQWNKGKVQEWRDRKRYRY